MNNKNNRLAANKVLSICSNNAIKRLLVASLASLFLSFSGLTAAKEQTSSPSANDLFDTSQIVGKLEYQDAAYFTHLKWNNQLKSAKTIELLPIINRTGVGIDTNNQSSDYYEHGNMPNAIADLVADLVNHSRFYHVEADSKKLTKADYQMQLIINQYKHPFPYSPESGWLKKSKSNVDRWFMTPNNSTVSLTLVMASKRKHIKSWSKTIEMTMGRCDINALPQSLSNANSNKQTLTAFTESTPGQAFLAATNYLLHQSIVNLANKRELAQVVSKHDNELFLKADNNYFIIGETVNLYHNDSYEMQRALPAGQVKIIKAYQNQAVAYPVTLRGDQIREGDWVEVGHLTIPNKPASYFTARNQCAAVSIANL
jgi:hypothetical protein